MDTNTIIWIVQILTALVFLGAGVMKISQPKDKLYEKGMKFVEDATVGQVKTIGVLELAGAIGLIFPWLLNILPILTPLAGVGLCLTMIGAGIVHIRRHEYPNITPNVIFFLMSAFVVYGRLVLVPVAG